jgi:aminoglycoside phosphotransferase (APT) family kinase protein
VRPLEGGTSSAVHLLVTEDGHGRAGRFVLRRYVRRDWLAQEPDLAAREAETLTLLSGGPVAAPRLVAVDPVGADADVPAVLMTARAGRVDWTLVDAPDRLHRLAAPLPAIHATPIPASARVRPYRPYELGKPLAPPPWTTHRRAWERAIEVYVGPAPSDEAVFTHRDYHPGNVLWSGGRVTGIVDWASASVGPAENDVGHCRANLADRFGYEVAQRFLAAYQAATGGRDYHPYWDIVVEVGPEAGYGPPNRRLDEFIARAVAQLG